MFFLFLTGPTSQHVFVAEADAYQTHDIRFPEQNITAVEGTVTLNASSPEWFGCQVRIL